MISKNNAKKNHEFAMQRKRLINSRKKRQKVNHEGPCCENCNSEYLIENLGRQVCCHLQLEEESKNWKEEVTHEELLARIAQAGLEPHGNVLPTHLVLALRAVVELHRPDGLYCTQCSLCLDMDTMYPCPTIQAIEKELG